MSSIGKLLKNPSKIVFILDRLKISKLIPDKAYLKLKYKACIGKRLNLKNPRGFNEKLQWLKLYDRNPKYIEMVDKHDAKQYVSGIIGEEYIIPPLGVWDSFEDIDFDSLPNQFVLKCTHDSGGLVVCRDKSILDKDTARAKINKCLKRNFYYVAREWPYKNLKPRIIAEKYMEDSETAELRDYKFYCFNGEPKMLLIASDRMNSTEEVKFDFFDMNGMHLGITKGHPNSKVHPKMPETMGRMIDLAKVLCRGIPFVRVDFYEVDGKIYFGELTFYPSGGFEAFCPEDWEHSIGDMLMLPET